MIDLEGLGITRDEILDRVVAKITQIVMAETIEEEDGAAFDTESDLAKTLQGHVQTKVDEKVAELAEKFVLPDVGTLIENFTLQATNQWGEKTGKKTTFIEYLVQRADAYIREPVNYEGKPKGTDSFSWTQKGTRIEFMIHRHLAGHIETAMTFALAEANKSIAKGIEDAIKTQLAQILSGIKVAATVK